MMTFLRITLLTLFSLVSLLAVTYKAVIDTYEKVQLDVYDAVIERLAFDAITGITVHVDGREVTLLGDAPDLATRTNIVALIDGLPMVSAVVNQIFIPDDYDQESSSAGG